MRHLGLALAFLAAPAFGATPSTANFAWDWEAVSVIDASVTGFKIVCCTPGIPQCIDYYAPLAARSMTATLEPTVAGPATCRALALTETGESAPSNAVLWERPSTGAPPNLRAAP